MTSVSIVIAVYILITVVIIPTVASLVTFRAIFGMYPKKNNGTKHLVHKYAVTKYPKKKDLIDNIFDFHYNKFVSHYAIFDVTYELQQEFPNDRYFRKIGMTARTMLILAVIYTLAILFPLLNLMGL